MDVKFVKTMSLAYTGYISKNFHPFPPFSLQFIAKHNLNPQQTAKHSSLHNKTNRAFLESEIVVEVCWPKIYFLKSDRWAHSQHISHPQASPFLGDVESNAQVAYCFFFHLSLRFEA